MYHRNIFQIILVFSTFFVTVQFLYGQENEELYNREAQLPSRSNSNPDSSNNTNTFSGNDSASNIRLDEPELLAQNNNNNNSTNSRALSGFADTSWKTNFSEVKTRLQSLATSDASSEKVVIIALDINKYILVKRNDILYRYNFYKTPYEVALLENHQLKKEEHDQKEAMLFHVKVITPFIDAVQVKEKISKLHGPNTKSTVDEKNGDGADIWELNGGLIFQWYEPYNKKPFTRSVDYLSTQMAELIMKEYKNYFDAKERLLLQKIILK